MGKLTVYIRSLEVGTVGFVDKEGAMHACAQAQSTAFESLTRLSGLFGDNYLVDEDRETLTQVAEFCNVSHTEYTIIDLGQLSFIKRLRLRIKGMRTPTVCCGSEKFQGVPSRKDLERLMNTRDDSISSSVL